MTAAPYTEEQAGNVWCPYVRMVIGSRETGTTTPPANRWFVNAGDEQEICTSNCCIASRCAAWRWFDKEHSEVVIEQSETTPMLSEMTDIVPYRKRRGCGLCGKPEFEE